MTQPTPPGKPLGMTDFFALEAGEYLERLDAVLQPAEGTAPLADEFVRLARALRGSALMANQHAMSRAPSSRQPCRPSTSAMSRKSSRCAAESVFESRTPGIR